MTNYLKCLMINIIYDEIYRSTIKPLRKDDLILCIKKQLCSRFQSLGVSREETAFSDVSDTAVELDYTLETNTAATMGRSSILEGIDVILDGCQRDLVNGCTLSQELGVVDTLSTTGDLLTSHEEIIRVCVVRVFRVDHGIEGASIGRVAVEHVEIGVKFLLDNAAEGLLVLSVQVLKGLLLIASLLKKTYTLFKVESNILALELLEWILLIDNGKFLGISALKSVEDMHKHL